ncbi:ATP-binding protein [Kosakonia sp. ML.JS2a]|uniref:AAA family ATPase n=1 Tax=Kosakonia sp. ML.JS2a TaxID=2980557 RepID=UPI0021D7E782|nr:ATP-binding protein [Kosakonia sp. ML.JS2a]UXY10061.1 ATP-binding protein [Kosakonia sp. ML.JS2a]
MIYSYGFKNYFGFKEGANVSFLLNGRVPKDVSYGRNVATILGVKGANGAGKTNLLKALYFLSSFCSYSFYSKEEETIDADPYFNNKSPSEFYIEFLYGEYVYTYELAVTVNKVIHEKLFRKSNKTEGDSKKTRKIPVFIREGNEISDCLSEIGQVKIISLKDNASLISSAFHYKFDEPLKILNEVYSFFSSFITNVRYTGLKDFSLDTDSIRSVSEYYFKNEKAFNFVKDIIVKSDLGISDVEIVQGVDENSKKYYFPMFEHRVGSKKFRLTIYDQSSGTKSLYVKLNHYWRALSLGSVLVLDEFDLNCHPFILPKLLELFESRETNPLDAQFIFTSHITEVLEKLSKYRTYLVNKENNECFCYRLDEIGGDILRHGRAIAPIYNEGKIGGVPKL